MLIKQYMTIQFKFVISDIHEDNDVYEFYKENMLRQGRIRTA
jgi:hypothetical protein